MHTRFEDTALESYKEASLASTNAADGLLRNHYNIRIYSYLYLVSCLYLP